MTEQAKAERLRLARVYDDYAGSARSQRIWDDRNPGNKAIRQERIEMMRRMLLSLGIQPSGLTAVLEVGCGDGKFALELSAVGIPSASIIGADINATRLAAAKTKMAALLGDGAELPVRDDVFQLVVLSTVLSSVKARDVRSRIMQEATRVLTPGGVIVVYDMRFPSPANSEVVRISKQELLSAAEGWEHRVKSLTVIPPLARRLGRAIAVYPIVRRIGPVRSHSLVLLKKPS